MVLCTENDKAVIVHRDEEEIRSAAKIIKIIQNV
jgi:hypothetical protein